MRLIIIRTVVLAFALIGIHPVSADFEAGQSAWDAGNVDEALFQWQGAANADDRRAMLELGRLYHQGLGVVQDYVEAHMWLNLAASRGEVVALEERNTLAAKMTPEQVATAQERAAVWQPGDTVARTEEGTSSTQDVDQPPPQAIRAAQSLLTALGYQPGPANGIWGVGTRAAYQAFLRDAGLPEAEILTPQVLRAMRMVAERRGIAQADSGTTAAAGTASAPTPSEADAPPQPQIRPDVLHRAAQVGDIEALKTALVAGMDVDARDSRGWTALMHAANKGYPLLVSQLLDAQAAVDVRAPEGATALFMAVAHGHTEIVELLMKAGADISIQGPKGKALVEVARTRYGKADAARQNGEPPAVLALLEGKTWVEAEESWKQAAYERKYAGEMVSIPGGTFQMGDLTGDMRHITDFTTSHWVQPIHRVLLPAFKLGKYEVTFAQWDACVADEGCNGYSPDDEGWGRGNRPVVNVSWDDAQSFIDWLNNKTGGNYRLPTEAEWEYAARAGSTTNYSWGDNIGRNRANCKPLGFLMPPDSGCDESYRYTAPVGSFPANAWGLHDMHGNVWEAVQDCWNSSYEGAPTDGSAWESGDCGRRVIRGGDWSSVAWYMLSASRHWNTRAERGKYYGFRLARNQ